LKRQFPIFKVLNAQELDKEEDSSRHAGNSFKTDTKRKIPMHSQKPAKDILAIIDGRKSTFKRVLTRNINK
jgi:hypothetical protein